LCLSISTTHLWLVFVVCLIAVTVI
jgi:hypothetical protein